MNPFRLFSAWYILAIPVIAGMSTLELRIGEFNYTGYLWVVLLPVGIFLLAMNRLTGVDPGGIFPSWPWLVWCGYVCLSLLWCTEPSRRNLQEALQFSMPIVVGMLAASAIRTHAEMRWLFAAFGGALLLLTVFTAAYVTERFDREWMDTHLRSAALAATLCGCVFLGAFPRKKLLPLAGWGACLLITALTSSRIATFGLLVAPVIHPHFRGKWLWKFTAATVFVGLGLVLFHTDTFQKHFFESGEGTIGDLFSGDIKDFGRVEAWSAMWDEAWESPLLGVGVGTAYDFVPHIWLDMNHIHNDYLRIFFELGLVGFFLFLAVVSWQLLALNRLINSLDDGIVRSAFVGVWLGLIATLISCITDNTILYHMYVTNPLFALMGAGYGAAWAERREKATMSSPDSLESTLPTLLPWMRGYDPAQFGATQPLSVSPLQTKRLR